MALGIPHPDYLLEVLTADQLAGWTEYYGREPWGFPVEDMRAAMQMHVAVQIGGSTDLSLEDFSLAQRLADGPPEEDGGPSDAALVRKLEQFMPPPKEP